MPIEPLESRIAPAPLASLALSSLYGGNGFKILGVAAGDYSGWSVSGAGDVNGDGFADVIIGAMRADANGTDSGSSYVVFGKASGFGATLDLSILDGTNGFEIQGASAGTRSGEAVSDAGDVNGDGFGDLLIGTLGTNFDHLNTGASYIVFGKASGFGSTLDLSTLDGTNGFKITGEAALGYFDFSGASVSKAGDVNGDGFADIIIGAFRSTQNNTEASYVVFGKASGFGATFALSTLNGTNGFAITGASTGSLLGRSVSGGGDINGDGFDDLVIGAPYSFSATKAGASYVIFGKENGFSASLNLPSLNGANGFKILGSSGNRESGYSVSIAKDINGDGLADIAIGAFGSSYVIYGKPGGFSATLNLADLTGSDGFKISGGASTLKVAGDVNADGLDDLIIGLTGSFFGSSTDRVYVVYGKTNNFRTPIDLTAFKVTDGLIIQGENDTDHAGRSVSGAGDVNGDGFADLLVGAFGVDVNGTDAGASYVIFGTGTGGGGGGTGGGVNILPVTISATGKTVTFTEADGDLVTVKTTRGQFAADGSDFISVRNQFAKLTLGAGFSGADIRITAVPTAAGGNGFVNLGFLDATGVDLGAVSIEGDLGRIAAGTAGGSAKVPGIASLTAQSIGLLGTLNQLAGGDNESRIEGALPSLTVRDDLRGSIHISGVADGWLGVATIGGSLTASLTAQAAIGTLAISGDIRSGTEPLFIATDGVLGKLTVGGSLLGAGATEPVQISAFGHLTAPHSGRDIAIHSIAIAGSVENTSIRAGLGSTANNADASIGKITVGRDWIASSAKAGIATVAGQNLTRSGSQLFTGVGTRDHAKILSSIGSITIAGQALGTTAAGDEFGILAQRIGAAKIGARTFAFKADTGTALHREAFYAAPTLDFTVRELSANLHALSLYISLNISKDGKTASFTDVDGDHVTVQRTFGAFAVGDFTFAPTSSGGVQLQKLAIHASPGDITITAQPTPAGGNGFVNVGFLDATNITVGNITVDGDLGRIVAGYLGVKSLTVQSLGLLGGSDASVIKGGLGTLLVKTVCALR